MAIGNFGSGSQQAPMAEINTTPLVDVMLVLLIVFMITAPLLTHSVNVDLPKASSEPTEQVKKTIEVRIFGDGKLSVNSQNVSIEALPQLLEKTVSEGGMPEVFLMADRATRYEVVAQVMSVARKSGVNKIGFATEPVN